MTETFATIQDAFDAAKAARANGDDERAVDIYLAIGRQFPNKKRGVAAAAACLRGMERYRDVIVMGERALATIKISPSLWMELALSYLALGLHRRAANYIQLHLDRDPGHAEAWKTLGICLLGAEDELGAEHAFARAVELNPLDPEALLSLGDVLFTMGRTAEGISAYQRA